MQKPSYWQGLALFASFLPFVCDAGEANGHYYLKAGLGGSWPSGTAEAYATDASDSSSVLFPPSPNTNTNSYPLDQSRGDNYHIAAGLSFADDWRLEAGYLSERGRLRGGSAAEPINVELAQHALSVLLWRDFSLMTPRFRPYLGAGLGGLQSRLAGASHQQWTLFTSAGVGLALTPQWQLDMSYQYAIGEDAQLKTAETRFTIPQGGGRWQMGLRYHFASTTGRALRDSDADGIADEQDRCPETLRSAVVDFYGCADSDGDGIIDPLDRCPNTPAENEVDSNGCMDSDNDGVKNSVDQCSNSAPGERVLRNGCAARQSVGLESIRFGLGETELNADAKARLTAVTAVMLASPQYRLAIQGHSDDSGDAEANYRLSRARARAVGRALVSLGVIAERIEIQAFGANMPVADNSTSEGRALNRRVSLKVIRSK
ncbi:OmpA family protein [Zhongshania sp.]|uniref:OmpA family protein n=1 Tax=Zhongshania sp. TaxID=1971902 RepID=UPI002A836BA8|nr:OmpA family protein [Zhongshania sp.]